MKVALIGSEHYHNVRCIRELLFKIKTNFGTNVTILTRGNKVGCEKIAKKYALEFGMGYIEYNPAHTSRTLYSGMGESYYDKPYHPTQKLHQYDCIVVNSDKVFYFGGIKPSERRHFERLLKRYKKDVVYVN